MRRCSFFRLRIVDATLRSRLLPAQALQTLVLDGTNCSDVSLLVACVFPQLLRLSAADNDGVTDQGASVVARRIPLTHLRLAGCGTLTDGAVTALSRCASSSTSTTRCKGIPPAALQELNSSTNQQLFTHPIDTNYEAKTPRPHAAVVPPAAAGAGGAAPGATQSACLRRRRRAERPRHRPRRRRAGAAARNGRCGGGRRRRRRRRRAGRRQEEPPPAAAAAIAAAAANAAAAAACLRRRRRR